MMSRSSTTLLSPNQILLLIYFIWINGGPGCSALHGLLLEIGPVMIEATKEFNNDIPKLVLNPSSWTKFLVDHPEYATNEFYVYGDSFSGLIVPWIAQAKSIVVLVWEPVTHSPAESCYVVPFAHRLGLISDELHEVVQKNCEGDDYFSMAPKGSLCYDNMLDFKKAGSSIPCCCN